jgi:hypothetical protein
MATAKLRVNPENTEFEIDFPDDSGETGDYNPGEGAVIIASDGTPYFVTFDEYDDTPPLRSNSLYKMVPVDMIVERGAEMLFEPDDDEDESEAN